MVHGPRTASRMIRRGGWVPLIPPAFRWPILGLWTIEPISRGIDYITGDAPNTTSSLTFIERAMPLQAWGVLCLAAGLTVAAGFIGRWPHVAIIGLHVMGCTYMALAIGLFAKCVERGGDGFRTPVMFAIFALTCWSAALGYLNQVRTERAVKELA